MGEATKVRATIQSNVNSDGLFGVGVSVFFSGCDKPTKCVGCHNYEIQDKNVGFETSEFELIQEIERMVDYWLNIEEQVSVCYLGGEPLAEWNKDCFFKISKHIKTKYQDKVKNILYTWRYIEDVEQKYLSNIDYGVFGGFQIDKLTKNQIPASSNQYIYDVKNNIKLEPIERNNNI